MKKAFLIILILAVATSMAFVACKADTDKRGSMAPVVHTVTAQEWDAAFDIGNTPLVIDYEKAHVTQDGIYPFSNSQYKYDPSQGYYSVEGFAQHEIYVRQGDEWSHFSKQQIEEGSSMKLWVRTSSLGDVVDGYAEILPGRECIGSYDGFVYDEEREEYRGTPRGGSGGGPYLYVARFADGRLVECTVTDSMEGVQYKYTYTYGDVDCFVPETYADTHTVTIVSSGTETPIEPQYMSVNDNNPTIEIVDGYAIRIQGSRWTTSFNDFSTAIMQGYVIEGWYIDGVKITGPVTITQNVTLEVRFTRE